MEIFHLRLCCFSIRTTLDNVEAVWDSPRNPALSLVVGQCRCRKNRLYFCKQGISLRIQMAAAPSRSEDPPMSIQPWSPSQASSIDLWSSLVGGELMLLTRLSLSSLSVLK